MESIDDHPPKCAVPLQDACQRFGDLELLEAWREAEPTPKIRVLHPGINPEGYKLRGKYYTVRGEGRSSNDRNSIAKSIADGVVRQLLGGNLVAWGKYGKPTAELEPLSSDVWGYVRPNWRDGSAVLKDGTVYYSVKVLPAIIADQRWDGGLSLLDAGEFLCQSTAGDIEHPRVPTLPDGTKDQEWAKSSQRHAIFTMWEMVDTRIRNQLLSIYVRDGEKNAWESLFDVLPEANLPLFDQVDFPNSQLRILENGNPVDCILTRYHEKPDHTPTKNHTPSDLINSEIDIPSQPQFSKDAATKAYVARVENWPVDIAPPSRADDEKWGKVQFNASRTFVRDLRKTYAVHWSKQGPKTKQSAKLK